ncbi:LamG-like jellyroll fold domain-containing protein [Undibacterium pigrum]|uniref:Putative pyrroloquinoline-quinone binding quinoprotein n=1 Tax=Undibacterium pigrum TaxID=401470 RepID=A0A318J797_9BURK|nr:LamG-like jellyroll fold domain-containing protein [Undibacterium pigrum]PXX42509.1 putative pyrroloquinoline-quinone binding quinoprotein [Undibacterium pigrum]
MTTTIAALPTPERLGELWRFDGFGTLSPQQPLVVAGDRLLGVAGSTLFAIDIFRGKEPVPDAQVAEPGFPYTFKSHYGDDPYLVAAAGVVYFMDGEELTALRLADGQPLKKRNKKGDWELWEAPRLSQVSGLVAAKDKIIAVHIGDSGNTEVSGFVAVNGEPAFGPLVISDLSPGTVSYGEGAVFFVADGKLHAVNVDFGDDRFKYTKGGISSEPLHANVKPCVARDVVIAASSSLHFFDVKTGAEVFSAIKPTNANDVWLSPVLAEKAGLFIASNSSEVIAVRTTDGSVAWRTRLNKPGLPSLLAGRVMVTSDNRRMLSTLLLSTGEIERRMELPEIAGDHSPVVANDTVFIPDVGGSLEARPFARQHAALFDGISSCIDIQADGKQFDFGMEDFSIEAWIRSSEGGEIVSSHVTEADSKEHGFRLNLGENGELRVAIVDATAKRVHAGRTRETHANDGEWHHIALIRRDQTLLALLDGKSLDVFFRDDSQAGLSIGGKSALTIGAARPSAGKPAEQHFNGLIRELRIWDRALDVATVQNNRHVALTGNEPRLKGLWTLSEKHLPGRETPVVNAVARHASKAIFKNAASTPTDLTLDNAGFPYLLHEVQSHWPYAGTWAARGQQPVDTAAALTGGAIAFGTSNALYGVRRADGRRMWQIDMPGAASAPVADSGRFFVLTSDDGLIGVNAVSGEYARIDAFAGFMKPTNAQLAAPAVTQTHLAAGTPAGEIRIIDRLAVPAGVRNISVSAAVRQLTLGDKHLFALCGAPGALKMVSIDLASGNQASTPVSADAYAASREWLFCVRDAKLTRVAADNAAVVLQTNAAVNGAISGIAARLDRDLVVVGTDKGEVYGFAISDLALRWSVKLPASHTLKTHEAHSVYAPVFDAAGRVCCTTSSGTIAILDPVTGARVGLYFNNQGIVTPAAFSAATAYYGCADAVDADAFRDGALHSVVFGDTMVLRLGLNELGMPSKAEPYAMVDIPAVDAAKHTLHLMDPSFSCIEAWVNVPDAQVDSKRRPGGGVLGICPTQNGEFDVNLEIDEDGTLHYHARSLQRGKWKMLKLSADAKLSDGSWHHIAVSRSTEQSAIIYIDGVAVPNLTSTLVEEAPSHTSPGLKAFIGAAAGPNLDAVRPFCGMIADVRVWDTYLKPAEIAARMHVKLRGSEPDLLAFWNFDRQNVNDAGVDHHHGTVVGAGQDPVWWLSDLVFEKPSYPYVSTQASIVRNVAGEPKTYKMTCKVHRADGTGMAGQAMNLWYVRNRDDQPESVLFNSDGITGSRSAEEPEPGVASPDGKQRVFSATTGNDGTVSFFVTPSRVDHTPAIDLRAGFMASYERFHVNVLMDEQMLVPATPPTLSVQSKLIQDYAYTSGNKIDESRDRSTWRTVIRVTNPDGGVVIGEPVSLWGDEQTTVQVAGRSYAINKENSAELTTDSQGEVIIISDASALTAPILMARAGFMHRNDRVVIAADQELHRKLANVRGSDFMEKRTTRWKPGMKEGDGEALLAPDYAPHADKVANAITTVMASAKPVDPAASKEPRGDAHMLRSKARKQAKRNLHGAERALFDAQPMRQPQRAAGSDRVATFRTITHVPMQQALNPEATRAALKSNLGFVFEAVNDPHGNQGLRFEMLETQAEVDEERGEATPERVLLRGFFGDLWEGIKDVATDIYEGAVKIVVSIADTVELAITKMVDGVLSVVHTVVNSVVEAANAVAGFFEQIGVMIMKAIEFLRALFNWKAIIEAKNIIKGVIELSLDATKRAMSPAKLEAAFLPLIDAIAVKPKMRNESVNGGAASAGECDSPAFNESRGVQGQMVIQKSRENPVTGVTSAGPTIAVSSESPFDDLISSIPSLISGLLDTSLSEMVDKLLAALKKGAETSIRLMIKELTAVSGALIEGLDWIMKILKTEIRVPFLSDLYRWITGSELSLLDLVCLGLAVPVHIAHLVVTTLSGRMSTFAEDNRGLVESMKRAEQGKAPRTLRKTTGSLQLSVVPKEPYEMDTSSETLIIVLRSINLISGLASDALFTKSVSSGGIGAASQGEARVRGMMKVLKGATGIAASSLQTFKWTPAFNDRMESGLSPEAWGIVKPKEWMTCSVFSVLVVGDAITLLGGVWQVLSPPVPQQLGELGGIAGSWLDKKEAMIAKWAPVACIALLVARTIIYHQAMTVLEQDKAHENLKMQTRLYFIRDVSMIVARMPWFMFTQTGANWFRQSTGGAATAIYAVVTGVRALASGTALVTHSLASLKYGNED